MNLIHFFGSPTKFLAFPAPLKPMQKMQSTLIFQNTQTFFHFCGDGELSTSSIRLELVERAE